MCGRMNVSDHDGVESLLGIIGLSLSSRSFDPRYNVAPTSNVLCVTHEDVPALAEMHWGLIPPWAKPGKFSGPIINARSESVRDKPSFAKAIVQSRIAIPANGFYEWRREAGAREAWYMTAANGPGMFFAGLSSISKEGELQCCVLTTDANETMQDIHHRMPVILNDGDVLSWLQSNEPEEIDQLMRPAQADRLHATAVTSYVNNARNEGPRCITPGEVSGSLFPG